jgi:hypothetical protein
MSRMKSLVFLLALAMQVPLASANTVTYAVGTCEPRLTSFPTIQSALNATPPPNMVKICPGTYNEQVVIGIPVTLEGISTGSAAGATIAVPTGGLVVNATNDFGQAMAAQVFVQAGVNEVNLTNLTIDGTTKNLPSGFVNIVGVFYLGSRGTLNHLTVQNQSGNGLGVGVWFEGGIPVPSVTLENSNLQGFDNTGVRSETNSSISELDATIKGNYLTASDTAGLTAAIVVDPGATASVSENLLSPGFSTGISSDGTEGSISKNTVLGALWRGIQTWSASVTSNTILNSGDVDAAPAAAAIWVSSSVAPVTGNTISQYPFYNGFGSYANAIDLDCTAGNNVHSNTIQGSAVALLNVATGAAPTNTYYNVGSVSGSQTVDECP